MKKIYGTLYKAYDGKTFENHKDCWDYEESYREKVNNLFSSIVCLEATAEEVGMSFDDEEVCYFVMPQSKRDIMILNVIKRWHFNHIAEFTEDDIGTLICVCVTDIRDVGILKADYINMYRWDMYVKSRKKKWMELERIALRNQILINDKKLKAMMEK